MTSTMSSSGSQGRTASAPVPDHFASVPDFPHGAADPLRGIGLHMERNHIRARVAESSRVKNRFKDHQVDVHKHVRRFSHRGCDGQADGYVRYEPPVHHVEMQPVRSGAFHISYFLSQIGEIRRQDRRCNSEHGSLSSPYMSASVPFPSSQERDQAQITVMYRISWVLYIPVRNKSTKHKNCFDPSIFNLDAPPYWR